MRTVHKWTIPLNAALGLRRTFYIPKGAVLLSVALTPDPLDDLGLWFEIDTTKEPEQRTFQVFGTGHELPDDAQHHVGTVVIADEGIVLHAYEMSD